MRRLFSLGLVTAAALFFAAPVAASEVRSTRQDVEEIRGMIRASQARYEGDLLLLPAPTTVEPDPAPVALEPVPAPVAQVPAPVPAPSPVPVEPIPAPAPEPIPVPAPVALEPAPAPVAQVPAPVPAPSPAPVEPIPAPAPEPIPVPAPVAPAPVVPAPTPDKVTAPVVAKKDLMEILNAPQRAVWLLVTDEAWRRADNRQDYSLGADLERGMPTLAAIRKHSPHLLPRALAILRGEEVYT